MIMKYMYTYIYIYSTNKYCLGSRCRMIPATWRYSITAIPGRRHSDLTPMRSTPWWDEALLVFQTSLSRLECIAKLCNFGLKRAYKDGTVGVIMMIFNASNIWEKWHDTPLVSINIIIKSTRLYRLHCTYPMQHI